MPILGISITPIGTKSASFSSAVTNAVQTIEQRGLKYQITPTETIIEGEIDELMDVAKEIHENAISGTTRVITNITIDDRRDKEVNMEEQVDTVTQSLH
jgi:uncharacterized protein (TIGR00106 family)